jgi:protein CMS1
VGTPQRLIDLIENGTYNNTLFRNKSAFFPSANSSPDALSLANLKRIVVDASHIDQKKRGIVDMRETMMPLAKLLCMQALKERYEDETIRHIDLLFY